ncbi:hypothetical protein CHUAL_005151 [Chamberlinius hualienensis]
MKFVVGIVLLYMLEKRVLSLAPPYYGTDRPKLDYELPPLEYGFSELEPYIDEETVRVHYLGHHSKYTEKMNSALKEWQSADKKTARRSIVAILGNLSAVPEKWRMSLKNNGGGFINHNFYWATLTPNTAGLLRYPDGKLAEEINQIWSSFTGFHKAFTDEALNLFGSGYVWLCRNPKDKDDRSASSYADLIITTTSNQDSPISDGLYPILVIDVWEHAYYLKHKNMRANYVNNWWKLVDWEAVQQLDDWWKGSTFHDEL